MSRRLDAILRAALDDISDMPLKVSDERWMQKLDRNEAELDVQSTEHLPKRSRRATR